jgi:hypothetical protein
VNAFSLCTVSARASDVGIGISRFAAWVFGSTSSPFRSSWCRTLSTCGLRVDVQPAKAKGLVLPEPGKHRDANDQPVPLGRLRDQLPDLHAVERRELAPRRRLPLALLEPADRVAVIRPSRVAEPSTRPSTVTTPRIVQAANGFPSVLTIWPSFSTNRSPFATEPISAATSSTVTDYSWRFPSRGFTFSRSHAL